MIKVFIKTLGVKAYLIGATVVPVVRQVVEADGLPPPPVKGGAVVLPKMRVKQVKDLLPMAYVVPESGPAGFANLNDIVPLLTEEQKRDLAETEIPDELKAEAERIRQLIERAERGEATDEGQDAETAAPEAPESPKAGGEPDGGERLYEGGADADTGE